MLLTTLLVHTLPFVAIPLANEVNIPPRSSNVPASSALSTPLPTGYALVADRDGRTSPWYWSLGASAVTTRSSDGPSEDVDFDEGWGAQLAVGRRYFGDSDDAVMFDLELEGLYTDQDSDSDGPLRPIDDLTTAGIFFNGLAALAVAERVELFAGGGLGLAWLDVGTRSGSLNSFDDEDGPFFAWQLRAGLRFQVGARSSLEVGYRFLNIDDAEIDDGIGSSGFALETQQHSLGLSIRFGG